MVDKVMQKLLADKSKKTVERRDITLSISVDDLAIATKKAEEVGATIEELLLTYLSESEAFRVAKQKRKSARKTAKGGVE